MNFYVDVLKDKTFRKKHGAHFTPEFLVELICSRVLSYADITNSNAANLKVLDLASGTGVFSYYIASLMSDKYNIEFKEFINNNCIMVEKDHDFVNKCKYLFKDLGCNPCIIEADALFSEKLTDNYFDIILSNPPYIRIQNIDYDYRTKLKENFESCRFGSSDIYYAFMEFSLNHLKNSGVMGFITPSSFLRNEAASNLRSLLSNYVVEIEDLGSDKYFDCGTYSALTFAKNKHDFSNFVYKVGNKEVILSKKNLNKKKFMPFYNNKTIKLKDVCKLKGGIATLRDNIFIVTPVSSKTDMFILEDGSAIEIGATYNLIKVPEIKTESDFVKDKYKCIFPYQKGLDGFVKYENEEAFRCRFPNAYNYLLKHKSELLKRDRGVYKGYEWFEFGRTQGFKDYKGDCIVTSYINKEPNFIKLDLSDSLIKSGIVLFDIEHDVDELLLKLNSKEMFDFIYENGARYSNDWRGYNVRVLEKFPLE